MPFKLRNSSNRSLGFLVSRLQMVFIIVFISVNTILFISSQNNEKQIGETLSSVYTQAADGQRYWGTAINLVDKKQFTIPSSLFSSQKQGDVPLARAGPLRALFFSLAIWIFGFMKAPIFIVALQCTFLFIPLGNFTRTLAKHTSMV